MVQRSGRIGLSVDWLGQAVFEQDTCCWLPFFRQPLRGLPGPGEIPAPLVVSHTRDLCRVENGWKCAWAEPQYAPTSASITLRSGEWRIFFASNTPRRSVQFRPLAGKETDDYGKRLDQVPAAWRWWRDAAKQIVQSPPGQYFIRIISSRQGEEPAGASVWEELLRARAKPGLAEAPTAPGKSQLSRAICHWADPDQQPQ